MNYKQFPSVFHTTVHEIFFSSVTVANLAESWKLSVTKAKKAVGEEFMYSSLPIFFVFLFSCLLATKTLFAQNDIPVGTWRTHLTYFDAHTLTLANNRVYCASQNALFYFDKDTQEMEVLSTIEGLSDTRIASLAYHETTKTLVIAYKNGNIDLLNDAQGKGNEQVTNIRSILNANQLTNKTIYHVNLDGDFAYLSTDFGVVVLDLNTQRIKETYTNIGTNGTQLKVYASTTTSQNIFLATEEGLRSAPLSNTINRLDFNNWTTLVASSAIKTVGNLGETIYFGTNQEQFYSYSNGQKNPLGLPETDFYSITNSNAKLLICSELGLFKLNPTGSLEIIFDEKIRKPQQAFYDPNNELWIADSQGGLTTNLNGNFENIYPSGTFSSTAVDVNFFDKQTVVVSGKYDENGNLIENLSGFYAFENGKWINYNSKKILADAIDIPNVRNLVSSTFNPIENKAYFASFGDGILVWDKTSDTFEVLNKSNHNNFPNNQVSAVVTDFSGNLWVAFYDVGISSSIFKKAPNQDNWESFRFPNAQFPVQLILDDAQNLWIRFDPNKGGKILTFNKDGDRRTLSTNPIHGELPSNKILTMINDKSGNIWVGTEEGLRVFTNAANTINRGQFAASRVTFDGRTLFKHDKITAIDVDGGNNKWIATEEGLFQFDDNADFLLENFNTQNSPLLSNTIVDLDINDATGEIFIATNKGLISYRGKATEGFRKHKDVKVFPNPVPPNYGGVITISGLTRNGIIKITDINGQLIHETRAQGGTATWNGQSYNGALAKAGVYLIFSASEDGEETFVTKIAIVN